MITIRHEQPWDRAAVWLVNRTAFESIIEPDLVDALRAHGHVTLSLVAEDEGEVVGHVLFSPLTIERDPGETTDASSGPKPRPLTLTLSPPGERGIVCMGPVAVAPSRQRQGIGGMMIEAALKELRAAGHPAVVLLGHPSYYPRFGFRPAREFGLHYENDRDAFMAIELQPGALDGVSGHVSFSPEFDSAH